jgi:AAHS family 4-hydroxybenzoate transporter-like MFS transporter
VGWALGIGRIGSIVGPVVGGLMIGVGWTTPQLFIAAAVPAIVASIGVLLIGSQSRVRLDAVSSEAVA